MGVLKLCRPPFCCACRPLLGPAIGGVRGSLHDGRGRRTCFSWSTSCSWQCGPRNGNSFRQQQLVPVSGPYLPPPCPQLSELGSLQPLRETDPCTYCLFLQRSGHELHRILPPSSRDARASQAHISLGAWALSLQGHCFRFPVSNYSSCSPLFLQPEGGSCLLW